MFEYLRLIPYSLCWCWPPNNPLWLPWELDNFCHPKQGGQPHPLGLAYNQPHSHNRLRAPTKSDEYTGEYSIILFERFHTKEVKLFFLIIIIILIDLKRKADNNS